MKHFHHAALKKEDGSGSGAEMTDQGEKEDGGKGEGQQQLEYMEFLDAFHRLEKVCQFSQLVWFGGGSVVWV